MPGLKYESQDKFKQYLQIEDNGQESVIFNAFSERLVGAIPNFMNQNTQVRWKQEVRDLMAKLNLDAVWLDKNKIQRGALTSFNSDN